MANPIQFLISKDGDRVIMASPTDNWETIEFLGLSAEEWVWGSWEIEDGLVFSEVGNYKDKILEKYGDRGNFIDSLVFEKEFIEYSKEHNINLSETPLSRLPEYLEVGGYLFLDRCTSLTELPEGLEVGGSLYLKKCNSLTKILKMLKVGCDLHLNGCISLQNLLEGLEVVGDIDLSRCTSLIRLPKGLKVGAYLYLSGCTSLKEIPKDIKVGGNIIR